jgi:hypothetical protein
VISAHLKRLRALIESGASVSQADIYMIDWATYGAEVAEENARIRIASVGARAVKEEVRFACFTCFTGIACFTCFTRIRIASVGARAVKEEVRFACFTCFTGTHVQILTPEELREAGSKGQAQASALLRTKLQLSLLSLQTALPQSRCSVCLLY